ncbi:lipopolysaccharide transport periplasmic protein LptA [Rhodoferax aquaticus]|uniref:Lipopolysaccharide export system protein LptA n=1 Tax=Rhodoferax aquaticus TaxID=2527691 RepID=A0A515EK42_9BURK|nr:lipopolysaccharide transport periplasmic protein LptA [Rhodoferax aquaticus]QDL53028.1 lipopolysaccharide transport periplasmic protein LptA [Rhodoferax aquaticus]
MKNPCFYVMWSLAIALVTSPVFAEKADRDKPMNIEADALRYDDLKQVSIFTGRVVLTKGTIQIRGHQVEVRQDPDGYQFGRVIAAPDALAFFRQKREGLEEFIEGEGETIDYDGKADTVKFTKKAVLRRLRGAVLADEITGGVIVYENLTDMFTVDGNHSKGVAGAPTGGRVRAMLTPKPDAVAPGTGAAAPALRATTTLGAPAK